MKRRVIAVLIVLLTIATIVFAPVVYAFHGTSFPGDTVTFYKSPSCVLFGIGVYYVYGHSIGGNGQTVPVSGYYWMSQYCDMIPS
jgi:hypothetical protein